MAEIAPLSPAEATVLLAPNLLQGAAAFRATLLFLLTAGVLRIEEIEAAGLVRSKKVAHVRIVAEPKDPPAEMAAVLDVVRAAQPDGGKVTDVVKHARKTFSANCAQFSVRFIIPALIARGLLIKKKLWFSHYFSLTPEGEAAQARIKSDLSKADDVARLLKSDPAQAAAIANTLGTTILLSDKLTKQFKPLADAMRALDSGGADTPIMTDFGAHGAFAGSFDFASIGHCHLGSLSAGAVDALHSGIGSFDAGFGSVDGGHHH
jgi:hypothetical protein